MGQFDNSDTPSYSPEDLAILEAVLQDLCKSRHWAPMSEDALQAGRFLLARFDEGLKDPVKLRALFEKRVIDQEH